MATVLAIAGSSCDDEPQASDTGAADSAEDAADTPPEDQGDAQPIERFDPLEHLDAAFGAVPDCDEPALVAISAGVEPAGVELADKLFQAWEYTFTCRVGIETEDLIIVSLEPEESAVVDCEGIDCMPLGYWLLSLEDCADMTVGLDEMIEIASDNLDFDVTAVAIYKPLLPETHPESGYYYFLFAGHGIAATVNAETGELVVDE